MEDLGFCGLGMGIPWEFPQVFCEYGMGMEI